MTQEEEILFLRQEETIRSLKEENRVLRQEQNNFREELKTAHLRISQLEVLLKDALDKLSKNSRNSSKPPSSDMFRKTKSLRTASGKKPGGQMGHKGTTLEMTQSPDFIETHDVERCCHCQQSLTDVQAERYEKRQVYDLPPLNLIVTEHRCALKTCPWCGWENRGDFPCVVQQPTQYGSQFKGLCVYLTNYQLLPYQRCAQLLYDLLGHCPSQAALVNMSKYCADALLPFDQEVKEVLVHSEVVNTDETGYLFCGKSHWLHVTATQQYTYYYAHEERGKEALDAIGILPKYKGVAMHDYWSSYLDYDCDHVFCHAHHLRDLTFCIEREKSRWAGELKDFLLQLKASVDEEQQKGGSCLSAEVFGAYQYRYWQIMEAGEKEHPLPQRPAGQRGRTPKSKSRNLLERFMEYDAEMIHFACDFSIPFSNNVAEQALRMMKVKQKISGCFRSREGAQIFARIRSYIDTIRKQGLSILESLRDALMGKPWLPLVPAPA